MAQGSDVLGAVRSVGYRTSLSLLRATGSTIVDEGDHLVVRTLLEGHFVAPAPDLVLGR